MNDSTSTQARILIVDDEPVNVRLLERVLADAGYRNTRSTTDSREVLALYETFKPDLILLDLMMPHFDGVAVMGQLAIPRYVYLPVLVLTADARAEARERALSAGARDFLTKPFDRLEVLLRIKNLLDIRRLYLEFERQNRSLVQMVEERTQKFLQSEKLATMGSLLAGVAHELNNPLAVLIGQAHLLREAVPDDAIRQRAEKIGAAAERCGRIVKNFLAIARQRPPERGDVFLNQVVHEAVELLAYELQTDDVEVVFDLAEDLPVLWADAHQLHQVVVNLVANAHQAMRRAAAARRIRLTTRLDRDRVWLEIADTGPGIPRELQAKIFEPFFTTKPAGQGTGLGLSLCRGIVEDHRGALTVESEPGGGATFRIDLPRLPRPAPAPEAVVPPAPVRIAPRRILVVDDEAEIAGVLAEALERVGHRVEVAANGAEALEILTARACDLVISDTKMPGLDGLDLYREVERRFPSLRERMIFVTGDVLDAEKLAFLERSGVPVLMKPFDVREVRHLVHQVLVRGSHES
jgi:signal transduction histidine kinase